MALPQLGPDPEILPSISSCFLLTPIFFRLTSITPVRNFMMAGTDQPLAFESFSPEPASQFPVFHDGDVLIKLSDVRYFQLHSVTLRENSDFFKLALTEEKAAQLNRKAIRDGIIVRYRFEYQLPYIDDDEIGQLYARVSYDCSFPCMIVTKLS